jgi:hypothetical protein
LGHVGLVLDFEFFECLSVLFGFRLVCFGHFSRRHQRLVESAVLIVGLDELVLDLGVSSSKFLQVDFEVPVFFLVPFYH